MPEAIHAPEIDDQLQTRQRTYVLDTSVLLSDPGAMHRFAEHAVVIPVIVIAELEKAGLEVIKLPFDQMSQKDGTVHCCTAQLLRE